MDRLPVYKDITAFRPVYSHNGLYQRAFTGTVTSDKRKNVSRVDIKVNAFKYGIGTE